MMFSLTYMYNIQFGVEVFCIHPYVIHNIVMLNLYKMDLTLKILSDWSNEICCCEKYSIRHCTLGWSSFVAIMNILSWLMVNSDMITSLHWSYGNISPPPSCQLWKSSTDMCFNSLSPEKCGCGLKYVNFKHNKRFSIQLNIILE